MAVPEAKVVVLGAQGVGKTSFIHQYVGNMFLRHVSPTIGASFFSCNINIDEHKLKLLIWDTAGQERFRSMAPMYYRNANAALLMFDLTSMGSYEAMKTWVTELMGNVDDSIVLCVVGNKCDMRDVRAVKFKEASEYAASIGALYHEASALSSEGVEAVFVDIAQELVRSHVKNKTAKEDSNITTFHEGKIIRLKHHDSRLKDMDGEERSFLCC